MVQSKRFGSVLRLPLPAGKRADRLKDKAMRTSRTKVQMQPSLLTLLLAVTTALCAATQSFACASSPQADQVAMELRATINAADHVFIGQIERVTKRRWGPEDQKGRFEMKLLEWQAEGGEMPEAEKRVLTYSDADARISIKLSLRNDGLDQIPGRRIYSDPFVDVDLLRPVRSPGDGLCMSFPMPCPWDVKVGDWVAVALEAQPLGRPDTTYCIRIDHPNLAQSDRIKSMRLTEDADEVIWPFVEASMPFLAGGVLDTPRPRPAPNRP
jgi:hypothetical protein